MDGSSAGWFVVAAVGFHASASAVHVPRSRPIGEATIWSILIAPLRHHVENPVNSEELFLRRVRKLSKCEVSDRPHLCRRRCRREIFDFSRPFWRSAEVVERPTTRDVLAGERDVEVVVELRVVRRDEGKFASPCACASLRSLRLAPALPLRN